MNAGRGDRRWTSASPTSPPWHEHRSSFEVVESEPDLGHRGGSPFMRPICGRQTVRRLDRSPGVLARGCASFAARSGYAGGAPLNLRPTIDFSQASSAAISSSGRPCRHHGPAAPLHQPACRQVTRQWYTGRSTNTRYFPPFWKSN